jgi:hypothetical protein
MRRASLRPVVVRCSTDGARQLVRVGDFWVIIYVAEAPE